MFLVPINILTFRFNPSKIFLQLLITFIVIIFLPFGFRFYYYLIYLVMEFMSPKLIIMDMIQIQ